MPDETMTDHDLLILLNRDVFELKEAQKNDIADIKGVHRDIMEQLRKGNDRFTGIALQHQEFGAALAGLRQDFSRAMLEIAEVKTTQSKDHADIGTFKTQVRTIVFLGAPIFAIVIALASELVKKWLGL